jgi:hypothetical protein
MYEAPLIGRRWSLTAADTTVVGSVSSTVAVQPTMNLIGILANMTVPDQTTIQLWAGTTATATANGKPLTGVITFTTAGGTKFLPVPAYCSGGLVVNVAGASDITLFWNPA